jgi:alanine racemase
MPRPIRATIDGAALRHNLGVARAAAGGARVWAVVKANAYGHGLLRAAGALGEAADGFALLDLEEAVALREAGVTQPILLLEGVFEQDDLAVVAERGLWMVVHNPLQVALLARTPLPLRVSLFLKVNTGMNRLGFAPEQFSAVLRELRALPHVGEITLMTHFADADGDRGVAAQLSRFQQVTQGAGLPLSCANSAALLRFPESCGDWVRPGIMLYGGSPFPALRSAAQLGLRPVMTLDSALISIQQLQAGERVGYGGLFGADAPIRVGVVACGYADGYPRHAPTGTPILVGGKLTRTLGRVSMDMIVADLSGVPEAGIGTPVRLWGEGLPADDVATAAGTVSYELFCALARRVPVVER